jgi:hypothetical protein
MSYCKLPRYHMSGIPRLLCLQLELVGQYFFADEESFACLSSCLPFHHFFFYLVWTIRAYRVRIAVELYSCAWLSGCHGDTLQRGVTRWPLKPYF